MSENYVMLVSLDDDNLIYETESKERMLGIVNELAQKIGDIKVVETAAEYAQCSSDGERCILLINGIISKLKAKKVVTQYELDEDGENK